MSKQEDPKGESATAFQDANFIAFVSNQIEANWNEKYGPLCEGFPLNIVYALIETSGAKQVGIMALYAPDVSTFRRTRKSRQLVYFNPKGGPYRVRVVANGLNGQLETFKYKGRKLVAYASGRDFRSAMIQTTMLGIHPDEPRSVLSEGFRS